MVHSRKSHWKVQGRGNVAIEYGLILPVLIIFTVGIMDTGRLLWSAATLNRAAEAAARCAAINTTDCGTTAQIQTRAVAEAWGLTIAASAFTITKPACGIQVAATYDFTFLTPGVGAFVPLGIQTLSATACYPL
jgi:Flp pilus assembly protein TadG